MSIKQTISALTLIALFIVILPLASSAGNTDDDPTIIIHDTIAAPGILLLTVDALNFTGSNGLVSAITLHIEVDTFLIDFNSIQNMTLIGGWIGNYNMFEDEITITYTAPIGTGYDINGKLLDIKLEYMGGFPAELNFKPNCEITNVNLQTIQNVIYENGLINQIAPVGTVKQDTVSAIAMEQFNMPVIMEGVGYDLVNGLIYRVGYDTNQLSFNGITGSMLTAVNVIDTNSILTITWDDTLSTVSLTGPDTVFHMNFTFIGDTNNSIAFLHGSHVINNDTIVASEFIDGFIRALLPVVLINNPDSAGVTLGEGYYYIGDTVTATAIPELGFHFDNWTQDGNTLSTDSVYTFVKTSSYDTLVANYLPNSYYLSLVASPPAGGILTGEGNYLYGQNVTVGANPAVGYIFQNWSFGNDTVSTDPVYTFTMPNYNTELIANFVPEVYTVTVEPNNPLYGTAEGGGEYYYGETATLTATPFVNYIFVAWTEQGQILSEDPIFLFIVTSNHNLIANFKDLSDCSSPVGLWAGNMSETSALLSWLPTGVDEEWDLIWGETGFDTISGGTLVEGLVETEYLLENLDPGTLYDFYVRAICTATSMSSWSEPYTFATWYVGIPDSQKELFVLYPNPTDKNIHIRGSKLGSMKTNYIVFNTMGMKMISGNNIGSDPFILNVETFPDGLYFIQIYNGDTNETISFIKK